MSIPRHRRRKPARDQHGSATVEIALLVPALLITLGLLAVGGRIWFARTTVNEAATSAARAASLSRSAGEAATAGRVAAARSLATEGLRCTSTTVRRPPTMRNQVTKEANAYCVVGEP